MSTTLWEQVLQSSKAGAARTAIIEAETSIETSFDAVQARCESVATQLLSHGIQRQERVAVLAQNSRAFLYFEGACAAAGITCVPVNFFLSVTEIVYQLQHSGARALIIDLSDNDIERVSDITQRLPELKYFAFPGSAHLELPSWIVPIDPNSRGDSFSGADLLPDTAIHRIMYTSATTGQAKGVMCPYGNWIANTVYTSANQLRDIDEHSRFLAVSPLSHMSIGYFWTFYSRGACTVTSRKFRPEAFVDAVEKFGITHTLMVPTMIIDLTRYLTEDADAAARLCASPLKAIWYAGSPMPSSAVADAQQLLGPILNQQYGSTELFSVSLTMCATMLRNHELVERPGSCGRPIPGTAIRLIDENGNQIHSPDTPGELLVKVTGVPGGYLDNPTATEETFGSGWMKTGDVGSIDADGYLYIVDRIKDMIIGGGFNVYPAEIEAAIQTHPQVAMCAVIGRSDPKWVEVPVAFIVTMPDAELDEMQIIEHCKARLAGFKVPKDIRFVSELPRSAVGKISKRRLRETVNDFSSTSQHTR